VDPGGQLLEAHRSILAVCTAPGSGTRRSRRDEEGATHGKECPRRDDREPEHDGDSPVVEAARLIKEEDVGSVPVLEGGRLVGTLTDRDIAIRIVAARRDPQSTKVSEVGSSDLVTIDPQQNLDEALRTMARHQVRRLPVVEEDGKLVGILAQADAAREGSEKKVGEAVEAISS
jgi:signal-transduction protein with cAMP-binding, CBS, and nucleotidyltransferase domain